MSIESKVSALLLALVAASCSLVPSGPSAATVSSVAQAEGSASTAAVTTERIQLRTSAGRLISAGLVNGQTVDVPLGEDLDIWAEIRRLETDRARLVVDWGNGNADFTGCGSCRLTNKYTSEGRFSVTARIVDLNAPTDSATVASVKVTVNVLDYVRLERFACATVTENFESFTSADRPPFNLPGVRIESTGGGDGTNNLSTPAVYPLAAPELINRTMIARDELILTFTTDKNALSMGLSVFAGNRLKYRAYDGSGLEVASGPIDVSASNAGFFNLTKGFARVATLRPFRRVSVVFDGTPTTNAMWTDNIVASCQ